VVSLEVPSGLTACPQILLIQRRSQLVAYSASASIKAGQIPTNDRSRPASALALVQCAGGTLGLARGLDWLAHGAVAGRHELESFRGSSKGSTIIHGRAVSVMPR